MKANGYRPRYTIWIEAEMWAPGQWNPIDDNSDVIVTFADRSRWVMTFYSYANIVSLIDHNRQTGECLGGKYFWGSDMVLVDEVSRMRIEEVIEHFVNEDRLKHIFTRIDDADDEDDEWKKLIAEI